MKKLLRIAVILCLALCLSVGALASDQGNGPKGNTGVSNTGEAIPLEVSAPTVTPTAAEAAATIKSDDVKAEDLSVVWVKDITAKIPEGGSVTITFTVAGATAEDTVYVLHYNGSVWERVATCKGNDVKAVFTSLSPVALVLEKAAAAPSNPSKPGENPPKTGEGPVLLVAAAVVLVAGAVAVVALKKKKEM